MASIAVHELHTTGIELFKNSESYLTELNHLDEVYGGQYVDISYTTSYGYSQGITAIFLPVVKGYEFAIYAFALEAIVEIVKLYSISNTLYKLTSNSWMNLGITQ
ncbi:hypothetical protein [Fortiea contorta]|uniref:hypothetical protein n=1 Tax=Fortiea contorta TaxID=1892405 RepID=UPI00034ADE6A|nr:hypothetical protein [Fortiea contorta]